MPSSSSSSGATTEGFVLHQGQCSIFFEPDSSASSGVGGSTSYKALYGADVMYSAVHNPAGQEFIIKRITESGNEVLSLRDFSAVNAGTFKVRIEPSGILVQALNYTDGLVGQVKRTVIANSQTTVWAIDYAYTDGKVISATLTKQVNDGEPENVRRLVYTHTAEDTLQAITQWEYVSGAWETTSRSYYRYYGTGSGVYPRALKYAVGPEAYAEMLRDGLNPATATDEQVSAYADHFYQYETNPASEFYGEVTSAATRDCAGCGGGGGGTPGVTYSRSVNPNFPTDSTDYNIWLRKTIRTLANGVVETYYTNFVAQVMLMAAQEPTPNQARQWLSYFRYNNNALVILMAQPSAVTGYDDTENDLDVTLRASDGLIHVTDYYSTTTATESTAGGIKDYVDFQQVKKGNSGTAVKLSKMKYFRREAGGQISNPVAEQTVYREETNQDASAITTTFTYEWQSGTTKIQQRVTTLPPIPEAQHGDDSSATRREYFDSFNNLTWQMDERGFITNFQYDIASGTMIRRIDDVDTSITSGAPSGWATPSGGGLNLISDFAFDTIGRPVGQAGPLHTVDRDGSATLVRPAAWQVYLESDTEDQHWTGRGYTTADYAAIVSIDQPLAYFRLGESSGTMAVNHANPAANATYVPNSAGSWTGGTLGVSGALPNDTAATAAQFNGTTGYAQGGHIQDFTTFTLEAWVKTTQTNKALITRYAVNSPWPGIGMGVGWGVAGKLSGWTGNGSNYNSNASINNGQWHHCVITYAAGTLKLYIDGTLDNTFTSVTLTESSTALLELGSDISSFTACTLDEVAVYNYALPAARIAAHYNARLLEAAEDVLVNPVSISKMDKAGRQIDGIASKRTTGSGKLQPTDTFLQTDWTRWQFNHYDVNGQLDYTRVYHTIPVPVDPNDIDPGLPGVNYDETFLGYDADTRMLLRTKTPGGTITRNLYDPINRSIATWVGTNDNPATGTGWENWSPTNNGGNMVQVSGSEYDDGDAGGDSNLTAGTQYVDASTTRVTTFTYDFRNRRLTTFTGDAGGGGGADSYFAKSYYDNLDRTIKSERYATVTTPGDGNLLARGETFYDDRGRVFETKTYEVDPTTGAVGYALTGGTWYDAAGNVIESIAPGAGKTVNQNEYDSLGRTIRSSVGYYNSSEAGPPTQAGGGTFIVMEESLPTYNEVSSVLQTVSRQRDAAEGNDAESVSTFRATFSAAWYDGIDRPSASASYGTNGGSAFTRPDTTPARSDDVLVASTLYNDAGEAEQVTDPRGLIAKRELDDMGRVTAQIDNYTPGSSSSSSSSSSGGDCNQSDANRTTLTAYNADGNVATLTAVMNPPTANEVTTYIYGATLNDSAIASNLLLRAIQYPTDTEDRRVEMAYNRAGQVTSREDQNGTVHAYDYDALGRQTQDRVTTLGDGVDDAVKRIGTQYDERGLVTTITSHDHATVGSGNVVNQIFREYNHFGQLIDEWQEHDGVVDTDTTPKVGYGYTIPTQDRNTIRPTSLVYPNGRTLTYDYGNASESGDRLNRVTAILDDYTANAAIVNYTYLGIGSFVRVDYPEPQVRMDLWGGSTGTYTGLDRFGRIVDLLWYRYGQAGGGGSSSSSSSSGAGDALVHLLHGYDRDSNRLWRQNEVARSYDKKFDQQYVYDGLNRLADFKQGWLDGSHAIPAPGTGDLTFQQKWCLDPVGNWTTFDQDDTGDGTFDLQQTRDHNAVNEITNIAATTGPVWTTPQYDYAGNTTSFPKPAEPTEGYTAVYDAWNRMVRVSQAPSSSSSSSSSSSGEPALEPVQENIYDGRGFRIIRKTYATGILDETRHVYFTASWRDIEERVGSTPDSANAERLFIWGLRYVDDMILRDQGMSTDSSPPLDKRMYLGHDESWNNVVVIDDLGVVTERYDYDAYGVSSSYSSDFSASEVPQGVAAYTGRPYESNTGLQDFRTRPHHPVLGAFAARDSIIYVDGMNLYAPYFAMAQSLDPYGWTAVKWTTDIVSKSFINGVPSVGKLGRRAGLATSPALSGAYKDLLLDDTFVGYLGAPERADDRLRIFTSIVSGLSAFNENPLTDAKNGKYRLFTRVDATFCCEGDRATQLAFKTDKEGGRELEIPIPVKESAPVLRLLAPDLGTRYLLKLLENAISNPVIIIEGTINMSTVTQVRVGLSAYEISWDGWGHPNVLVEPGMQLVALRTSWNIWHRQKIKLYCKSGIGYHQVLKHTGSFFPSHRLWINGVLQNNIVQGSFSDLWNADQGDSSMVKGAEAW